jgi:hypothetical protein
MANPQMRQSTRYRVAAPVSFFWSCSGSEGQGGEGVTIDISKCGVWIVSDVAPPLGASIQVTVTLPRIKGSQRGVRLEGEGVVVRSENSATKSDSGCPPNFAASVLFYPEQWEDADLLDSPNHVASATRYTN